VGKKKPQLSALDDLPYWSGRRRGFSARAGPWTAVAAFPEVSGDLGFGRAFGGRVSLVREFA
jgi:hypothetical protein